jgi:hypothetical protein
MPEATKPKVVRQDERLSIRLPEALWIQLQVECVERGVRLSQLIREKLSTPDRPPLQPEQP